MAYTDIDKPEDYFNTKLFVGTGATQSITGVGFQPDWIWFKNRTDARAHALVDSIRGTNKVLQSESNVVESTTTSGRDFESFDSDGFTVNNPLAFNSFNESGDNIVAWNWLAGGTGASNTDGSITSTVSASTVSGFSIVTYTGNGSAGATIGHGLGTTPSFIIIKCRSGAHGWYCYHKGIDATAPEDYFIRLDTTDARVNSPAILNDTAPTNSVITLGSNVSANGSGLTYVAYCFAPKSGYSSMGSYTGNGNADGTFVYTGFKPAFTIIKQSSGAGERWVMDDAKRSSFNEMNNTLFADGTEAEYTAGAYGIDFLSNGIKLKTSHVNYNQSAQTYIYMCFAESPFVTSTGIPTTAR